MSDEKRTFTQSRFLLPVACFVVVIWGLSASQAIVVPVLLSIFVAILCTPPLLWLKQKGLPAWGALVTVILSVVIAGALLGTIINSQIRSFMREKDTYAVSIGGKLEALNQKLAEVGLSDYSPGKPGGAKSQEEKSGAGGSEGTKQQEGEAGSETSESFLAQHLNAETVMSWLARALSALTGVIADAFFIFVTVLFILGEASTFAGKLELAFGKGQKTLGPFEEFLNSVNRYLIIKTGTSILTGVVVWIFLAILGVKFAPLWGLISFLLNYIPTLGSILAAIPPVMLALVDIGLGGAVGVAAGQAVINVAIGNVLEPRLMGKELGLSALVIFISLAFWGSVLGIGGALLSVPLTVAVKIALNVREDTRWLAILMGSQAGARETVAVSGDSESGG